MENEKLVLANDKFSKEFFESMRLRYPELDISKDGKRISLNCIGNKVELSINRVTGELEHSFPSIGFRNGIENFNDNILVFDTFKKFWYHARMMKKVEDIYTKGGSINE